MWVINQDGISIVNVEAVSLDVSEVVKENTKVYHLWGSIHDHDFLLGTYSTLDKAKEIILDFLRAIKNHAGDTSYVYHVPGDDSYGC